MNHFSEIRAKLDEYEIDAMLLTSEANRFYASGFPCSDAGDALALVAKDETYFWTDSRYIEAAEQQVTDAKIALIRKEADYTRFVAEAAERHGWKAIGFEEESMTVQMFRSYQEQVHAAFRPAGKLLKTLRMVKSGEELEALIGAQRIAERALGEILHDIRPGVTEQEIAAKLTYLMLRYGAEKMSFDPIVASGANGSKPHAVPGAKTIEAGEFVTMDFGCVYRGYCSDMTRMVAVGSVTEEMKRVYQVVWEAQRAGIAAAKAGVRGCDVHQAAAAVIEEAGYGAYFGHGFGHSLGLDIHERPNLNPREKSLMPENAVVSAEPGIYLPGRFGVRIEDVMILRSDGSEVITKAPKDTLLTVG